MALPNSFRSLRIHNYRRYFIGQIVSLSGTWAQNIGLAFLVLDLSKDSGVALGVVTAMQFVPVLLLGLWMGLLADRFDKRRFIVSTQIALAAANLICLIVLLLRKPPAPEQDPRLTQLPDQLTRLDARNQAAEEHMRNAFAQMRTDIALRAVG